jgi:hypothetical protein
MAAGAHFSLDGLRELSVLADTLGAHADAHAIAPPLKLSLQATKRRMELTIGPFRDGSCQSLRTDLGVLAAELAVDRAGESETLRLVVSELRS